MSASQQRLESFVRFCQEHLRGDEKGEAQVFLDRFFRAFGYEGAIEAGASYEARVSRGSKRGNTGFADLLWKPKVLIEMKKRGEDLGKYYSQVFDYWVQLVPDRPNYVLLCNFDEFWIYDFNAQLYTPLDQISLPQLPGRAGAFAFMEKGDRKPIFGNNQVEVTEKVARRMGELLLELTGRGIETLVAQRFILQSVLAMFAEDRQLLPRDIFIACIQDCLAGESSYDVLGGLFREMNTPGITPAGRFAGVEYFNGGLFKTIHPIELTKEELKFLDVSAREDWSKVRPAIFGNLFEGTVDKKERHARGIHYTSEADIMKIVEPTITRYWKQKIEAANTLGELNTLQLELQQYRVLDPACGSGNFLYMAYQEMKRIESDILAKIAEKTRSNVNQLKMSFVTPLQFFGMDTNPFAVELARVTLMIARKIAIDTFSLDEPALPLDSLDQNIVCQDALFTDWVKADAIIGNPPFLGGYRLRQAFGDEYTEKIYAKFSDVKDQVDFCSYWFRLAHEHLNNQGRAGLVGTNTVSQGNTRRASLDYITQNGGIIHDAVSTQPWSGEAKVHVSIVNWIYKEVPRKYLDNQSVLLINSTLKATVSVNQAVSLQANSSYGFKGVMPGGKGFLITEDQMNYWIKVDKKNEKIFKLIVDGSNLAKVPHGKPDRWIIDFQDMNIEEAIQYTLPFKHIEATVKPERDINRREIYRVNWWKYGEGRPTMRRIISSLKFYFAVPRVSKWFIFLPAESIWLAGDSTTVVASEDFYILGILTSKVHRIWVKAQSSTLKGDTRYTHNTCFETFPFPQTVDAKIVEKIRQKMQELHDYRSQQMETKQWGITTLYNNFFHEPSSQLFKLHSQLDDLVLKAYQFSAKDDLLEKLLEMNLELSAKEKQGEKIIGPWAPID